MDIADSHEAEEEERPEGLPNASFGIDESHWIYDELSPDRPPNLDRFVAYDYSRILTVTSPSPVLRYGEGREAITQVFDILQKLAAEGRDSSRIFGVINEVAGERECFDLGDLIEKYGGKNFGDLLLRLFYDNNEDASGRFAVDGGFEGVGPNEAVYVPADFCRELEILCPDIAYDIDDFIKQEKYAHIPNAYLALSVSVIYKVIIERFLSNPRILEVVERLFQYINERIPGLLDKHSVIRGSQVHEDWFDTGFAGVSPGASYAPLSNKNISRFKGYLIKIQNCDPSAVEALDFRDLDKLHFLIELLTPYVRFFYDKKLSMLCLKDDSDERDEKLSIYSRVDIPKDDALALQIAPKISLRRHVVAVIEKTEDGDLVRMDVKCGKAAENRFEDLSMRIEVDDRNNVSIYPAFDVSEEVKKHGRELEECLCEIDGSKSFIPKNQILAVAALMKEKREFFGFPVDCEFGIEDETNRVFDFQTRLAPTILGNYGEIELNEALKIAQSPFVLGQKFVVRGKALKMSSVYKLMHYDFNRFLEIIGDPSQYILLLDCSIGKILSYLLRMHCEKGLVFGGIIDLNKGLDLTHSEIFAGGTYFLRHNVPTVGRPDNIDFLVRSVRVKLGEMGGEEIMVSGTDIAMVSEDGRHAEIYIVAESGSGNS